MSEILLTWRFYCSKSQEFTKIKMLTAMPNLNGIKAGTKSGKTA